MKNIYLILSLIIITSCTSQTKYIGEGEFNLEKIDFMTFNVSEFYSHALTTDSIIGVRKEKIDKRGYTITDKEDKEMLGYRYNVYASKVDAKIGTYKSLSFSKIEVIATKDNKLMAIYAYSGVSDSIAVNKTISKLNATLGKVKMHTGDWFGEYTYRTWYDGDKTIQLVKQIKYIPKLRIDENGKSTFLPEPTLTTKLFITIKKYKDKIQGKMSQSEWLIFNLDVNK